VAGLEWSLDGLRWHPAERSSEAGEWRILIPPLTINFDGQTSPSGSAEERLWTRAIDDSCNIEHPPSVGALGKAEL